MRQKNVERKKLYVILVTALMLTAFSCSNPKPSGSGTALPAAKSTPHPAPAVPDAGGSSETPPSQAAPIPEPDTGGSSETLPSQDTPVPEPDTGTGTELEAASASLSEEQLQELYGFIKESVKSGYLEPAGILPEAFQWPKYEVRSNGVIRDEGHAWSYLNTIALNYSSYGTCYDIKGFLYEMPDEHICKLMNAVLDGMVEWQKLHGQELSFQEIREAIFPEYEKIPQYINFLNP